MIPTHKQRLMTLIILALFLSPAFLQGCDALVGERADDGVPDGVAAVSAVSGASKFRHAHLLDKTRIGAGKIGTDAVNLVIGFNEYEADGVTRRLMDRFAVTKRLLSRYGDSIRPKVETEDVLPAITVQLDADSLESLIDFIDEDPDIAWVEPDALLDGPGTSSQEAVSNTQYISWGVKHVGARQTDIYTGNDLVHVYVFDSGVTNDDVNVVESVDFTRLYRGNIDGNWSDVISTYWLEQDDYWSTYWTADWSAVTPGETVSGSVGSEDRLGHGTHVAGIIGAIDDRNGVAGVAPNVAIHNIKVLANDGRTDITTVLAALEYVTTVKHHHPDMPIVVNMSLGADIGTTGYNALDEAIEHAIEDGIVVVVAAGNNGKDASTYSPAHVRDAITVGAFDESGTFSSFSNHGSVVDLLAPGEFIVSLSNVNNKFLAIQAGTSQAAPHVAGAAALYLTRHPAASPYEVQQALVDMGKAGISHVPAGTTNRSVYVGDIVSSPSALSGYIEPAAIAVEELSTTDTSTRGGKGASSTARGRK
ncbi:MAG: S8 family serine peptidase [Rhodothermales bacterium]